MKFDQDFIERVRNAHNIVDFIATHTTLKKSGAQYMGLCPFPSHREKTASFSVSEDKQIYHCFGCGKGGNLITFLQEYQGMSFPQAIEFLANKAGIALPEESNKNYDKQKAERNETHKLNDFACKTFAKELKRMGDASPVKSYLKKRGLSLDVVEEFSLGWAPDSWNHLVNELGSNKLSISAAEVAGLVRRKNSSTEVRFYDYFRARLMFPILSPSGEVLGFGGRTLGDENPKYLNSPDTPVFNKGRVLFGLNKTAKFIRAQDQVIVVEGYMDFLALYQAGIQNVVAVLGTALTNDHCRLLQRFTKNVLVLFDGDSAGIRAAERSLPILLSNDLLPRWCKLPDELDPDEYLQTHGPAKMIAALQKSEEMFLELLNMWMQKFSYQNYEKVQLVNKVAPILQQIKNISLKELYLKELCLRLRVDQNWLVKSLNQNKPDFEPKTNRSMPDQDSQSMGSTVQEKIATKGFSKAELDLLGLVLSKPNYLELLEQQNLENYPNKNYAKLISLAKTYRTHFPDDFNKLAGYISSMVDTPSIVTQYVNTASLITDAKTEQKLFSDCVNWIRGQNYREKAKEMMLKLQKDIDPDQLEQFMNINKKKHGILST